MENRFDYVKYDDTSVEKQLRIKGQFESLESLIEDELSFYTREKEYVMKGLEEAYMWVGKYLRNAQIAKNGHAESNEQRG